MKRPEYTIYDWVCANADCKAFQYEARVPKDRSVDEYRPNWCNKCGGIQMSERVKGAAA